MRGERGGEGRGGKKLTEDLEILDIANRAMVRFRFARREKIFC